MVGRSSLLRQEIIADDSPVDAGFQGERAPSRHSPAPHTPRACFVWHQPRHLDACCGACANENTKAMKGSSHKSVYTVGLSNPSRKNQGTLIRQRPRSPAAVHTPISPMMSSMTTSRAHLQLFMMLHAAHTLGWQTTLTGTDPPQGSFILQHTPTSCEVSP